MAEVASAYVSLLPSAQGFGRKLDGQISSDINKSGKKSGLSFGKLFAAGAALGIGAKAFSFLGDSLAEAREAQVIGRRTENVIKTMGNAARVTAEDVGKMAGRLSAVTGIDDEAIQSGSNMLLTFGKIRNYVDGQFTGTFDRANALMVDMSAAMGTDMKGSAVQLGKALNDPVKGVSALSRVGVSFTEQQKEQIKTLVESGKTLGAQNIILGEVEKQFGGAAEAMATPADKAKVAFGNLQEELGSRLLPVVNRMLTAFTTQGIPALSAFATAASTYLRPILRDVGTLMSRVVVPAVASFINGMRTGTGAGGQFVAVLRVAAAALGRVTAFIQNNQTAVKTFVGIIGTAIVVTKVWRGVQLAMNFVLAANPIGIVVLAIAALAAGIVIAYKRSETFRNVVNGAFDAVKSGATTLANFVTKTIPAAFDTVVTFVRSIPSRLAAIFTGAASVFYNAGVQLMAQLAAGITAKIGDAINAAKAGLDKLKGLLPGSPIKWGPLKNWNNGGAGQRLMDLVALGITKATPKTVKAAKTAFEKIGDALKATRDDLRGTLDTLKADFASLAGSVAGAFTGDLFGVSASGGIWGTTKTVGQAFIDNLMAKKGELTSLLSSFTTLKGWGLDPAFLSQLFASGNGALITELAGMGQAGAVGAASLFGDVQSLSTQLGNSVASNDPVASRIDETNRLLEENNRQISFLADDIGDKLNGAAAKARRNKKNGG